MKYFRNALNGQNQWWKYLLVFLLSFFGASLIGSIPLVLVVVVKIAQSGNMVMPDLDNLADIMALGIDPNLTLLLALLPFAFCLAVILLLIKPLHKRSYKTLFSGIGSIRWNRFFVAAVTWTALMAIYLLVDYYSNPEGFVINFNAGSFIPLVIVSLLLFPIQASYEEVLFRGYLAQGVAAWTKNKILVILIPAILFGMMHAFNKEVKDFGFWVVMPQYILIGVVLGLVSVLDDGIELAMGAHSANNIFLSLFVTHESSSLQTPALLVQQNFDAVRDLLVLVVISVVFIVFISRLYKFDFKQLFKKVEVLQDT